MHVTVISLFANTQVGNIQKSECVMLSPLIESKLTLHIYLDIASLIMQGDFDLNKSWKAIAIS